MDKSNTFENRGNDNYIIIHYAGNHHFMTLEDKSQKKIADLILEDFWKRVSEEFVSYLPNLTK